MLPPLHNLSLATVDAGAKRMRGRDESVPLTNSNEQNQLDWSNDKSNWKEIVCRVWDGRPLDQYDWSAAYVPYLSPDGNWKNRELVYSSTVEMDEDGVASCNVLSNIHGFYPDGVHNMDMALLSTKLDVHYPVKPGLFADAREFAFSTLPASTATRYDIQSWADELSVKGFAPWWTGGSADDFKGWEEQVKAKDINYELDSTKNDDGRIVYPSGHVYIGETKKHQGRVVPDGVGMLQFLDKSIWRGRWRYGRRTGDMGVFTDPDGNFTIGIWPEGFYGIKSATALAQEELDEWNKANSHSHEWIDSLLVEKPGYGKIAVASAKVGAVLRMANWHTETTIARMMGTTNPFELGVGRDTLNYIDKPHAYTKLVPLAVFDADYTNSYVLQDWERYQAFLNENLESDLADDTTTSWRGTRMMAACPDGGFFFNDDIYRDAERDERGFKIEPYQYVQSNLASLGVPLRDDTNEQFLLHGINPDSLFSILNTSFDMSYAGRGMFGGGIYFADDPGKSDQYATPSPINSDICKRLGLNRDDIKRVLRDQAVYPKRVQRRKDALIERAKEKMEAERWLISAMNDEDDKWLDELDINEYLSDDSEEDDDYDVFFMLVARVPLGLVASLDSIDRFWQNRLPKTDKRTETNLMSDATTRVVDGQLGWNMSKARELVEPYSSVACQGHYRYREYIVYRHAVARVSHVIAYCRARQKSFTDGPPEGRRLTRVFKDEDKKSMLNEDNTDKYYMHNEKSDYSDPFQAASDSEG